MRRLKIVPDDRVRKSKIGSVVSVSAARVTCGSCGSTRGKAAVAVSPATVAVYAIANDSNNNNNNSSRNSNSNDSLQPLNQPAAAAEMADNPLRKTVNAGRAHLRRLVSREASGGGGGETLTPPTSETHQPANDLSTTGRPAPLPPPPRPSPPRLPAPAKEEPSPQPESRNPESRNMESPAAARRRRDQYAANSAAQPSIIEKTTRKLKPGPNAVSTVETSTTIAVGNDMYTIGECMQGNGRVRRGLSWRRAGFGALP